MSRLQKVKKNVFFSYLGQILTAIFAFICRTVFIHELNAAYLGLNGVFANILGILSMAELGFSSAMNFEMYKPVAEENYGKTKALLLLYKKIYHIIGIVILAGGVAVIPFLQLIIKESADLGNIYLYYILYVINTVIGYYASYLFCLSNAEQNEYISTIFNTTYSCGVNIFEIVVLLRYRSFLLYLLVWLLCTIIQQISIKFFFAKKNKKVLCSEKKEIDEETRNHIKKNMGGLIISRLCEALLLQTDNIIIATGINIVTVGFADNYNLIISYIKKIVLSLLKSVVPSLGNMVALEDKSKGYQVFRVYDFIDYLIYSIITICLITLFQPFVKLWAGDDKLIDYAAMVLLCTSLYIDGRNQSFMNYKTAHGIFYDTKIVSIVTVILNLVISIWGVMQFGLIGVYIGTCVSGLYQNIRTLMIAYKKITNENLFKYYCVRGFQAFLVILCVICLKLLSSLFHPEIGWVSLIIFGIVSVCIAMVFVSIPFWKTYEYEYIRNLIGNMVFRRKSK